MTNIRYSAIRCNGCGFQSHAVQAMRHDPGAVALRSELRAAGWTRIKGRPGRDFCPGCSRRREADGRSVDAGRVPEAGDGT